LRIIAVYAKICCKRSTCRYFLVSLVVVQLVSQFTAPCTSVQQQIETRNLGQNPTSVRPAP